MEAFPEFGEKSIQQAASTHWNVFSPHAIFSLSYHEYNMTEYNIHTKTLHCNFVSDNYSFQCILVLDYYL